MKAVEYYEAKARLEIDDMRDKVRGYGLAIVVEQSKDNKHYMDIKIMFGKDELFSTFIHKGDWYEFDIKAVDLETYISGFEAGYGIGYSFGDGER